MPMLEEREQREETAGSASVAALIDRAIREAYIYLDALDRRTLVALTPPLTPAQYHALTALARRPAQNLGELAAALLCDKANASGLVDRLVGVGLADSARDRVDRRRVVLTLTAEGRRVLHVAAAARRRALERALAPLDQHGLEELTDGLLMLVGLLREALDKPST
jgi:DNA-binding MarR family transcriptional regulator